MMKKLMRTLVAAGVSVCSGVVTDAIAAKQSGIENSAKEQIKTIYPEFMKIVDTGADEAKMTQFAEKYMDTEAISKRFCGANNERLIKTIIKFLIWRLKTEAIQSVKDYSLDDNMQAIVKSKMVEVKCKLSKKSTEPVNMTVSFTKNGEKIGKIKEIKVLEIPLIEGAKTPMKKYFESNGIKVDAIKDPAQRAEKCCLALEDFIASHGKKVK